MVSSETERKKTSFHTLSWWVEHLGLPILVVSGGIAVNNYYQARKQPNLVAYEQEHEIMKASQGQFRIKCPFTISNIGGSTTNGRKVTLLIPRSASIDAIDISEEYKSFYDITEGGCGHHYVVISADLPKKKSIKGAIVFYSNVEIPAKSMCPLNIIY